MPGQLLRETNPAQGYAPSLVPQHEDVNGDYKATGEKNPLPVSVEDSGAAAQVDIQYRKQKMVPLHPGTVIVANAWSTSSEWIDTDGYDKVAFSLLNDAAVTSVANLLWSHDKTTNCGEESGTIPTGTGIRKVSLETPTKARYLKLSVNNGDGAAPHTISTWAYLKV